ncbi:MAG: PAS domain S-box protein [Spirochaetes bacterium]|nr:PAS domain S-box protein [Spirochaetota bacterium]
MNTGLDNNDVVTALLENEAFGIYVTDMDGELLAYNKIVKKILNISDSPEKKNINNYYYFPDDRNVIPHGILKSGHMIYETRMINSAEEIIWVKIAFKSIKYNGRNAILGIIENINDKKEIENELIDQQNQEKIVRNVTVNLLNTDFSDIEETINSSLKIIGKFYNVDYVAFAVLNMLSNRNKPQYYWSRDEESFNRLVDNNFDVEISWIKKLFAEYDSLLYCCRVSNKITLNEKKIHNFFKDRGIASFAGCVLKSAGQINSYFGMCNFSGQMIKCPKNLVNTLSILLENFYNIMQKKETFFLYNIFRYAVEYSKDAIVYFDKNSSMQACNDFFRKIFSIEKVRISELELSDIFSNQFLTVFRDLHFEKCMNGENQYLEQWYEFNDGIKRFAGFNLYPFKNDNGKVVGVVMIIQDKTENYKNETEILTLREEERQKIGLELHDDLSHDLLEIAIGANTIASRIKDKDGSSYESLKILEKKINLTLEKTRSLSKKFCSFYDFEQNMYNLVEKIVENNYSFNIDFTINCRKNLNLKNPFKSESIFYILSESIVNIVKHSSVKKILIDIEDVNNIVYVKIKSDGITKENKIQSKSGIGFKIMKCRARIIEASLDYQIRKDGSTEIFLNFQNN